MLKNILNLEGAQKLSNNEQKNISGGRIPDLSQICGYYQFRSTESQCLSLSYSYRPIWNASTQMCSVLGSGTNCAE